MNSKSPYNSEREKEKLEHLLEELSGTSMYSDALRQDSDSFDSEDITVTNSETEQALNAVKNRLGLEYVDARASKQAPKNNISIISHDYILYLAAIIVLSVGISYFWLPVTTYVPYGETATVELPDGSSMVLNSGTEIQYNRLFGITNRHLEFNGEAYFQVEPADNVFVVEVTNGAVVEVAGTKFNVRSWSGDIVSHTVVSVASGTVNFYPVANKSSVVKLNGGLSSSWRQGQRKPSDPEKVDITEVIGWKENKLSFVGRPLRLIFDELERKFDTRIEIEGVEIGKETLTTYYSNAENIEMILDDIATVKGLNYRETANGYIVFKNDGNG